jgi:hypothetical protein
MGGHLNKDNPEFDTFNSAMNVILKADPKAVKIAMEADKQARKSKKQPSASRASNASDQKPVSSTLPVTSA